MGRAFDHHDLGLVAAVQGEQSERDEDGADEGDGGGGLGREAARQGQAEQSGQEVGGGGDQAPDPLVVEVGDEREGGGPAGRDQAAEELDGPHRGELGGIQPIVRGREGVLATLTGERPDGEASRRPSGSGRRLGRDGLGRRSAAAGEAAARGGEAGRAGAHHGGRLWVRARPCRHGVGHWAGDGTKRAAGCRCGRRPFTSGSSAGQPATWSAWSAGTACCSACCSARSSFECLML